MYISLTLSPAHLRCLSLNRNRPIRFYAQNWGDFDPIPELNQTDDEADLTLLALSTNDVIFEQPVTDPWYSATTEVESQEAGQALRYFSDHPASLLAARFSISGANLTRTGAHN